MIVIGYQGIGKSTLAEKDNNYIDLESGNFWVNNKRSSNWYKVYCNIAENLSKRGFIVFTSSHKEVRDEFKSRGTKNVIVCYPGLELKNEWISKLEKRYKETNLIKDYKALMNAKEMYDKNITDISADVQFTHVIIHKMSYVLEDMLTHELEYFMTKCENHCSDTY